MKKYLLLIPAVFLLAAACNNQQATTQPISQNSQNTSSKATKTYINSQYSVAFNYPDTWTIADKGSVVELTPPAQNGQSTNKLEITFSPWKDVPEYYDYTDFIQDKTLGSNAWRVRKIVPDKPNMGTLVYVTDKVDQIVIVAKAYDFNPDASLDYKVQTSQPFNKQVETILKSLTYTK